MNDFPRLSRRAACMLLLAGTVSMAYADDEASRVRAIVDAAIRPMMARHEVPGMAVAVTVAGHDHVIDYGVASRESLAPVGDTTLFEIGSLSKTLTATLAGYAEAVGALSLSDHPGRYLPALRNRPIDRATLSNLGTYTAGGLPLQFPDHVAANDAAALAYLAAWKPLAAPGTERRYSNPSLGLLGVATASALKSSFADAMRADLLVPLGMAHSHLTVPADAMADYAWGYRDGRPVHVSPGPFDAPTYGVKTTAADMLRFVHANMAPEGLQAPLRRAIEATQVGRYGVGPMVQGLGWEQYPWPVSREQLLAGNADEIIGKAHPVVPVPALAAPGPRLFDKTGSTGGFGAYVAFVPSRRLGIVMLANTNWPIAARVEAAHEILEALAAMPE